MCVCVIPSVIVSQFGIIGPGSAHNILSQNKMIKLPYI